MAEEKMMNSWGSMKIHAEKANSDANGNNFVENYATKVELAAKQDTISDIETIRSGATLGATAVQPSSLKTVATTGSYNDLVNKPDIPPVVIVDQQFDAESTNAQSGTAVAEALVSVQTHMSATNNPHAVTKDQVGLGNVDNTSDATKKTDFTGQIAENDTGFVTGGEAYTALSEKANKSDVVQANWWTDDETDPSYIQHKPTLYTAVNYDDEHYRQSGAQLPYIYNCHQITADEISTKQFVVKLPLGKTATASNITLMGDIYSIRGLTSLSGSAIKVSSSNVDSIDIVLGDSNGNKITNEPIIRHIDSSELAKSDINQGYNSSLSQCRFHFTHFGSCTSSATRINTDAEYLRIVVTLASNQTDFVAGNIFQVLATWVVF